YGKGRRIGSAEDVDLLYRVLQRGMRIVYVPRIAVAHAHGRAGAQAVAAVEREYVRGRGAFYCKFLGDREIAKMAYWEVVSLIRAAPRDASAAAALGGLAAGALCQSVNGARS